MHWVHSFGAITVAQSGIGLTSSTLLGTAILGALGLLSAFIRAILTGRLVPGKERDYWRDAFFEEQRQKRELMISGQVTAKVLRSLPQPEEKDE